MTTVSEPTQKQNKELAKQMANAYGWRGKQWSCLASLWGAESSFQHLQPNRQGSSAFGIAQLLGEKSKVPAVQITRGMKYISKRYSEPCRALTFFHRHGYH